MTVQLPDRVTTELLRVRQVPFTHPDVTPLLVDQVQAEYTVRYGGPDETPLDPATFDPPGGAFFVGYLDDGPAAMGGWRIRPDVAVFGADRVAEVERMFVVTAEGSCSRPAPSSRRPSPCTSRPGTPRWRGWGTPAGRRGRGTTDGR